VKSAKLLGRSESTLRNQNDYFDYDEIVANEDQFQTLENLLHKRSPDTEFRYSLVELISLCRSMHSMWLNAPRRKLVREELQVLRKRYRQHPDDISEHLDSLSSEAMCCLEKNGLLEATDDTPLMKIITATIKSVPKDVGGVEAKEGQHFVVDQFAQFCKSQTRLDPALTYNAYNNLYGGTFLDCLVIFYELAFKSEANKSALAETFKLLFYKKNSD
jgi:hypothetical protein